MKGGKTPRVVVVTRPTQYDELITRHATRQQAEFFLKGRGQSLASVDRAHQLWLAAVEAVSQVLTFRLDDPEALTLGDLEGRNQSRLVSASMTS